MSKPPYPDDLLGAIERRDWCYVLSLASRLECITNARECRCRESESGAPPREPESAGADARARQVADARARQVADARARQVADARARQVADARTRQVADARARQPSGRVVFVTGAAGFIGSHLARRLLDEGDFVIGFDDFNDYYDPVCKYENIADLLSCSRFAMHEGDIRDLGALRTAFASYSVTHIVHLAARAGVRPSLRDPQLYVTTNVLGTQNMLEMARHSRISHFVYASSSSVYGGNTEFPFTEQQVVDHPVSPYAATKKANEAQASCYGRLYGFPVTGLRFFTVYGPGGRPDMAIRMFIEAMDRGAPIPMFGDGGFERDFTYIDDIVEGIVCALRAGEGQSGWDEVFNLGESDTTSVRELILMIAKEMGKLRLDRDIQQLSADESKEVLDELVHKGMVVRKPEQPGDVPKTYANIDKARARLGYAPRTRIADGIRRTVAWHREQISRASDPARECLHRHIRTYVAGRQRAALDSFGQVRDPVWRPEDLEGIVRALQEIGRMPPSASLDPLTLRIEAGLLALLAEASAYVGGVGDTERGPRGLDGLAVHRDRRRIMSCIQAGNFVGIDGASRDELLALATRIVAKLGECPTTLVVNAADYRVRSGLGPVSETHEHTRFDDEPIGVTVRQFLPFVSRVIVLVTDTNADEVANVIAQRQGTAEAGCPIQFVTEPDPFRPWAGVHRALADVGGVAVFTPAIGPAKSPDIIAHMVLLQKALGAHVPLVIPCRRRDEHARTPFAVPQHGGAASGRGFDSGGRHPSDPRGHHSMALQSVGIFAADASAFGVLSGFERAHPANARSGESKQITGEDALESGRSASVDATLSALWLEQLVDYVSGVGIEIAAPCLASPDDEP